ncbi:hypothetical protein KP509_12G096100 [Ceratopteris richardii]|uniref:LysM domain receptor-like kinase 3 n=1 Tax=Ceratopteris richardii TaxID=49495 RepID=A0A8T2TS39_CERRI|nr:hypothetical protein KP509_12G096100 [Ceratopteris richardii]
MWFAACPSPLSVIMVVVVAAIGTRSSSSPLRCHDPSRVCSSYLYYMLSFNESKADVASVFNVGPHDLTLDPRGRQKDAQGLFIRVNCSCVSSIYVATTSYYTTSSYTNLSDILNHVYGDLAWVSNISLPVSPGQSVPILLLCGCLDNTRDYGSLLSYPVQSQDTLATLAAKFDSSILSIVTLNNITNENVIHISQVYYVPINIAPLLMPITKANAPDGLPPTPLQPGYLSGKSTEFPLKIALGIAGGTCLLILVAVGVLLYVKKALFSKHTSATNPWKTTGWNWCSCSCCEFKMASLCMRGNQVPVKGGNGPATVSAELMTSNVRAERPVFYAYEEILNATENFTESNVLGQGAFGIVYYGLLRDQEVAIKRMRAIVSKEFLIEMKILCKFHHTNLNELLGYAYREDELFLIYEYAEHRALADRLHDPISKGFTPLTWNARVQIAIDAARGLEYIHEHTKEHYVHRDVKTSNILLDGNLRAKIADFGLAKLVEKTSEGEASVTRIVGTFGYLAPEYSRDGIATSKSDIYAFGVVLFELITGREAVSKSKATVPTTPERRSLTSIMMRALRECPNAMQIGQLRALVDPNLLDMFPQDCLYKMAKLGQQCVEEDPILRPDMKYIVFVLSQILLSSIEWEATLAGNSQIFSGLVQGR